MDAVKLQVHAALGVSADAMLRMLPCRCMGTVHLVERGADEGVQALGVAVVALGEGGSDESEGENECGSACDVCVKLCVRLNVRMCT